MRPRLIGYFLAACLTPATAAAQPPAILFDPETTPGFISRYAVFASAEALAESGSSFDWDADIGVGVDFVDYGRGRVNIFFNYEMVLGSELQPFDPRQGNYTFDLLATLRRESTEFGLLFRHVSRHYGDRAKDFGIAWNDLGVQVVEVRRQSPWLLRARGFALATVARGFVDYGGDLGGDVAIRRSLSPRLGLIGSAGAHARLTRASRFDRGTQVGARLEVGIRVQGEAGAVEIVLGGERRVDADALELTPRQWLFAGARIVTK
jgi:hypothetical protein